MSKKALSSRSRMRSVSSLTFHTRRSGIRLKSEAWLIVLAPEQIYNPENQRERDAQHNAGHDRKIDAAVLALIGDITGQTSKPKWQSSAEGKKSAYDHESDSAKDEQLSEFARWVHCRQQSILLESNCSLGRSRFNRTPIAARRVSLS